MNKVKTGISGLDAVLYGGIPEYDQVVLAGGPGTGKTLMGFEFLYKNAKMGNTSIFFALEENPEDLVRNAEEAFQEFTDIEDLIKSKKLIIDGEDPSALIRGGETQNNYEFGKLVAALESEITTYKANRVVIDSLSVIDVLLNNPGEYRRSMISLINNLKRLKVTSWSISELSHLDITNEEIKPEFFMFDGLISLYEIRKEDRSQLVLTVQKMRGSNHSFAITPYEITPRGFNIISAEGMEQ